MITIYKYQIIPGEANTFQMPKHSKILTVQEQKQFPCIWAKVNTEYPQEERTFLIFGTGHPMTKEQDDFTQYIGTFQLGGGSLVFHLFEKIPNLYPEYYKDNI